MADKLEAFFASWIYLAFVVAYGSAAAAILWPLLFPS